MLWKSRFFLLLTFIYVGKKSQSNVCNIFKSELEVKHKKKSENFEPIAQTHTIFTLKYGIRYIMCIFVCHKINNWCFQYVIYYWKWFFMLIR